MIYTIGTSNRSFSEFLAELEKRSVTQIVDVRSSPQSRLPWFSSDLMVAWAQKAGILYRWEGEVLGGCSSRPITGSHYRAALERLIRSAANERIAIFCAEGAPEHCHRCFDVGAALLAFHDVTSINILRNGQDEDILETLKRVPGGRLFEARQGALFSSD